MYAVVAPGLSGIYHNYSKIEDILAIYPYAKFRKLRTEEECWSFIDRYSTKYSFGKLKHYGNTFPTAYVEMEYFITDNEVLYNFRTEHIGYVKLESEHAEIRNHCNNIQARLSNIILNNNMISGHMIAIYHGINILGPYIDVDIKVPDHSIFYALRSYTGNNRIVRKTRDALNSRFGEYAITIK